MNDAEALTVFREVQKRWYRHPLPAATMDVFVQDMRGLPFADAMAAVEVIATTGDAAFPPGSGDVAHKVAELQIAPPSWDEVRRAIVMRAAEVQKVVAQPWRCDRTTHPCDGSTWTVDEATRTAVACTCREALIRRNRSTDLFGPLVRTWIDQGYLTSDDMGAIAAGDSTVEAQARDRWKDYVRRLVTARSIEGMPNAGKLQAQRRGSLALVGTDAAAALPAAPADVILDVVGAEESTRDRHDR